MSTVLTAPAAAPVEQEPRRKRAAWRPLAAAAIAGSVLVTTGFGVWASLSASASNVTPQDISTGTLSLKLENNGAGFTEVVQKLAPADSVLRYVTLTNTGTLAGRNLSLAVASTGDEVLRTGDNALRISVHACATAWKPAAGGTATCDTTPTELLASTALTGLSTAVQLSPAELAAATATTAGGTAHLRITTTLPDATENTHNGVNPTVNTVQGKAAKLTYTFNEVQRAATTTSS